MITSIPAGSGGETSQEGGKDHGRFGMLRVRRPSDGAWIWVRSVDNPVLPGAIPFSFSPGTLAVALNAEKDGLGHVEFRDGEPVWCAGPARFPVAEVQP